MERITPKWMVAMDPNIKQTTEEKHVSILLDGGIEVSERRGRPI